MYYVHTDHLGSLNVLTNDGAAIVQETSYDAWGNRRDPATLQNYTTQPTNLITDRGFTGHEHMDAFGLINMNGRVYDPVLGRFLNPDPFVADPSSTQDYNRYSYCGNSPLMYTDPSGYYKYQQPFQFCWGDWGGGGGGGGESIFPKMGVMGEPASGSYGYTYDWGGGSYIDIATGRDADSNVATNWARSNASSRGEMLFASNRGDQIIFSGSDRTGYQIAVNSSDAVSAIAVSYASGEIKILGSATGLGSERTMSDIIGGAQSGEGEHGESPLLTWTGGTGYGNHALGYWAEKTADITYKYGQRVNGVVKSAAQITAENSALWGKVALRFNVAGGVLGAGVNGYKMVNDFSEGNYAKGGFEAAKTASYTFGLYLLAVNPAVGGVWLLGTGLVDLGGDIYEHFSKE